MKTRFLLVGTIVCAIALFAWQSFSNAVLPWHTATMRELPNDSASTASIEAIRSVARENGVYFSHRGVVAAVSLRPDLADRSQEMGGMLGRQFLLDLAAAFVLCLVVARMPAASAVATGATLALAALAFSAIQSFSDAIWYGYTYPFAAVNAIDHGVQGAIAGLVLGAILNRMRTAPGVRADGGMGAGMREPSRVG